MEIKTPAHKVVVLAAHRLGVTAILANTKDIDGRAVKTTIGGTLRTEIY